MSFNFKEPSCGVAITSVARVVYSRRPEAEEARVNNSRHIVSGIWLHYFFKDHKSLLRGAFSEELWQDACKISHKETKEDLSNIMSNPAETYENYMGPTLFAPWAITLVQSANPQPGERVLDVACGTGIVARRVAVHVESNGKIVGLDLNPHMLTVARAAARREGLAIEWHEGRAEKLPFPDGAFDLALCQFALMFFDDRRAALAEMHRVLAHGGRVLLSVWQGIERHPFYQTLHEAILARLGMSGVQDIFALGGADELRGMLTDVGFRQVEINEVSMTARFPDPEGFLAGEIDVDTAAIPSMQHLDAQARIAIAAAIHDDMKAALREVTKDDHVVIPFHAQIARAELGRT